MSKVPSGGFTTSLLVLGLICLLAVSAVTMVPAMGVMDRGLDERAMARIDLNMKVAWHLVHELGGNPRIVDGKMSVGNTVLNDNSALVDDITALVGGVATVFQGDERIQTSITDLAEQNAVGTLLEEGAVKQALFNGHPFRGNSDAVGASYYAGYDPILDDSGTQIGILFVGIKKANVTAAFSQARIGMLATSATALFLITTVFLIVSRRLGQQIAQREHRMGETNENLALALESMANGLTRWSDKNTLLFANSRAAEMMDLPYHSLRPGLEYRELIAAAHAAGHYGNSDLVEIQRKGVAFIEQERPFVTNLIQHSGRIIRHHVQAISGGGWLTISEDVTEREVAAAKIRETNENLAMALENVANGICRWSGKNTLLFANRRASEILDVPYELLKPGLEYRELIAVCHASGHYGNADLEHIQRKAHAVIDWQKPHVGNSTNYNGRIVRYHTRPMSDGGCLSTLEDVTERETAAKKMAEINQNLTVALEAMVNGLVRYNAANILMVVNRRAREIMGLSADVLKPGLTYRDVIKFSLAAGKFGIENFEEIYNQRLAAVERRQPFVENVVAQTMVIRYHYQPMSDGGWLATMEDVTEWERANVKVAFMAHHDALTQLPNRVLFNERLKEALVSDAGVSILFLDLDGFKEVNDRLGHPVGDLLLQAVATRLLESVRLEDTVARLGGDEFAILQTQHSNSEDTIATAERILRAIGQHYDINGEQIVIGVSVGIAVSSPNQTEDLDTLLKQADVALYTAKAEGRGMYRLFKPEMHAHLQARRILEADLRKAVLEEEFVLFYQPIIDVQSGAVSGFEALLRWRHPTRGLVYPDQFIPVAEATGLIVPIGAWVLRQACGDAAGWADGLSVAVNLSSVQFRDKNLLQLIQTTLMNAGLPPKYLELEITESVLMQDADAAAVVLYQLRDLGIRIGLDDFGTGYSSLSYVRNFPFDKIKIDRSFVSGIGNRRDSSAIIRSVICLANGMGIETVAEGVETLEQFHWLAAEGCDEVQGYLFSVPKPVEDVPLMLGNPKILYQKAIRLETV